ncbi:hypothetical protein EJD97_015296 [Solanum chilense]|uniref:Uncharacterized protein n=1 Tax=Solanum chilense TaxID=4083 RepID=A0A6N2C7G9_SOLCI|nr:hypothetical protein EJD97_015296 [Solanum chilense]
MTSRTMTTRRVEEERMNEEIPPLVEQVLQSEQASQGVQATQGEKVPIRSQRNEVLVVPTDMNNVDIRESLLALVRAMTTDVNMGIEPRVNALESTMTSRLREFVRMNPPMFLVSKVGEDPQKFPYGVSKVFSAIGVTLGRRRI